MRLAKHAGMRLVMAGVFSLCSFFSTAKGVPTPALREVPRTPAIQAPMLDSVRRPFEITGDSAILISPVPTQTLCGTELDVLSPESSLLSLGTGQTSKYLFESVLPCKKDGPYHCVVTGSNDTFSVFMNLGQDSMRLEVRFPAARDFDKEAAVPGARNFDLGNFVTLVRCLPKTAGWSAMRIFVEKTGGQLNLTSAFMLPVDSEGSAITALGKGTYLALAVFYYCGCIVEAKPIILREKGGAYSISVAGEKK